MIEEPKVAFARYVEELVSRGAGYIDAVCEYCAENGIEIEAAAAMIKKIPALKQNLQAEAQTLRMVKGRPPDALPLET